MMASRGMGAIRASKMPKPVTKARRDDTDFTEYKKGGKVGSASKRADCIAQRGKTRGKFV